MNFPSPRKLDELRTQDVQAQKVLDFVKDQMLEMGHRNKYRIDVSGFSRDHIKKAIAIIEEEGWHVSHHWGFLGPDHLEIWEKK